MSKKTENIYKSISHLEDLKNEISIITKLAENDDGTSDESEKTERIRHLENVEFEIGQELKSLKFWIDSLYLYNGKSTSRAKQNASKENGKKGGRPPKEITEARRKIREIEENELPEMEKQKNLALDADEESKLDAEIAKANAELGELREKVGEWENRNHLKPEL